MSKETFEIRLEKFNVELKALQVKYSIVLRGEPVIVNGRILTNIVAIEEEKARAELAPKPAPAPIAETPVPAETKDNGPTDTPTKE